MFLKKIFKNNREKVVNFVKENKWILLASAFFVGWKFYLISVFFKHEFSRAEEALTYIAHINSIDKISCVTFFCKNYSWTFGRYFEFEHLSYRALFGSIGNLLKIDATGAFHLSFYLGILMLVVALIIFLKNIETDKKIIAMLLFFLTLYNGGRYHGFWWVVPGFFASLIVFLIYAIILGEYKHWKLMLLILIPLGFYTHTIFVYLMVTTVFFYFFYCLLTKKTNIFMLKKIIFSLFILTLFYLPTSYYLKGNPYGLETFLRYVYIPKADELGVKPAEQSSKPVLGLPVVPEEKKQDTAETDERILPGFTIVKESYFDWIFFSPLFIIVFIYVAFITLYYKKYKIIALYLAALTFTLVSMISVHADRSLTFIWPATFLLYAYGMWLSYKLIDKLIENKTSQTAARTIFFIGLAVFIAINLMYSYGINTDILFCLQCFIKQSWLN